MVQVREDAYDCDMPAFVDDNQTLEYSPMRIEPTKRVLLYPHMPYDREAFEKQCAENVYEAVGQKCIDKDYYTIDSRVEQTPLSGPLHDEKDIDSLEACARATMNKDIVVYTRFAVTMDPNYLEEQMRALCHLCTEQYPELDFKSVFDDVIRSRQYHLCCAIIFFAILQEESVRRYYCPDPNWEQSAYVQDWLREPPETDETRPLPPYNGPDVSRIHIPAFIHLCNTVLPNVFSQYLMRASTDYRTLLDVVSHCFLGYEMVMLESRRTQILAMRLDEMIKARNKQLTTILPS